MIASPDEYDLLVVAHAIQHRLKILAKVSIRRLNRHRLIPVLEHVHSMHIPYDLTWLPTLDAYRTFAARVPAGMLLAAPSCSYVVAAAAV